MNWRRLLGVDLTPPTKLCSNLLTILVFGVDPKSNTRLALAITNAKQAGFPKASIEAAIARGQGVSVSGAKLENLTVEAMFPGAVAFIIEAQAESKAHTLQQIRMVIKDKGGRATTTSHLFEKRGRIVFQKKEGVGADEVLGACLDAEEDVMPEDQFEDEEQKVVVDTKPDQIRAMEEFLVHKLGLEVESSELLWRPNPDTMVSPELEMIQSLAEFEERLTDISGVQGVYTNATAKPDEGDIEEDQKMASAAA